MFALAKNTFTIPENLFPLFPLSFVPHPSRSFRGRLSSHSSPTERFVTTRTRLKEAEDTAMISAAETATSSRRKDVEQQFETPCIGLDGDLEKQASDEATVDSSTSERTAGGEQPVNGGSQAKPSPSSRQGAAPLTLAPDDPTSAFYIHA